MNDAIRRKFLQAAEILALDFRKVVEAAKNEYDRRARSISDGVDRITTTDRAGNRVVSESMDRTRNVSDADRTGHEPSTSERLLAPPLDPRNNVNRHGLPETQRRYLVDDYIRMWERHRGREMTPDERRVLAQGCVGVTKVRLGQTQADAFPPTNLAFADPGSHRTIQDAEKVLAPGEVANAEVKSLRDLLTRAENTVRDHGLHGSYTYSDGTRRSASEHIQYVKDLLEKARDEARETWWNLAKGDIKEMLDARHRARVEGDQRTFEKVQNYVAKLNDILATKPADVDEFMRRVKADPELAQLRGVDRHLPTGNPSEWKPVIYSKHFWSGQEMVRDGRGDPVLREDGFETRAKESPDPTRFAPDSTTGQVDMSGDYNLAKPGYVNYDYGLYDEQNGSWWHANHGDFRVYPDGGDPLDPMKVYQSTSEKFFSSYSDFDSSVICIGFAKKDQ